jgi:hypothetical protein
MRFGFLLEFHKIPEWYTQYCLYHDHKKRIDEFRELVKEGTCRKLKGYYTINKKGQIYCIDFIKNYKDDVKQSKGIKKRKLSIDSKSKKLADEEMLPNELRLSAKPEKSAKLDLGSDKEKLKRELNDLVKPSKQLVGVAEQEETSSLKPRGEHLDLIDEVSEEMEDDDEDLVFNKVIGNMLLQSMIKISPNTELKNALATSNKELLASVMKMEPIDEKQQPL